MNPHFVFNTIASISQDLKPETVDNSKKLLGSFARLMRANLEFAYIYNLSAGAPFNEVYTGLHNIQVAFNFLATKPTKKGGAK